MEFAQVLYVLWRRRGWLVLGLIVAVVVGLSTGYRISVRPLKLEPKALAIGAADTQLLVDTPRSALTDVRLGFEPLAIRAAVFTRVMTTRAVRRSIANQLGVSPDFIETEAPIGVQTVANEPNDSQRSRKLLGQNLGYRLRYTAEPGQPTINISAQATTAEDARRLADGAAQGFIGYLARLQRNQKVSARNRVVVRQLGAAKGGTVGGSINNTLMALATIGVLIGWVILVVIFSSIADTIREIRRSDPRPDETGEPAAS
jgi:hypothetical protein